MRKAFAQAVIDLAAEPDLYFLTGDLGFMALEGVRDALGERFINCGLAEQNMVGVAAGLAREGLRVIVYSIAPFCYARPFEQIRNDLSFTRLPVTLVGNGGGYAYGAMGPTHHALEDCAVMSALGIRVLAPAFDDDITPLLRNWSTGPCYLRLGLDVRPENSIAPVYTPIRSVLQGNDGICITLGSLAGLAWNAFASLDTDQRPEVWAITELPFTTLPSDFCEAVSRAEHLRQPFIILEEHNRQGGLGMQLLYELALLGLRPSQLIHRYALGYPSGRYGSQNFHRKECGIDLDAIRALICP